MGPDPLAPLGIHRIAVPVPFADAGGPVNAYVLEEDEGFTLFDTGIGTAEGEAALMGGLQVLGCQVGRLRRIFLSHGHVDHYGLAERLANASGATVHLHRADWSKVLQPARWSVLRPIYHEYLAKLGVPDEEQTYIDWLRQASEEMGDRVRPDRARALEEGDRWSFRQFEAEVLHLPGHTPGLVCLYARERRILFADDHVLARVSPNPLLDLTESGEAQKFKSLVRYLESARRVLKLDVDWVLPGHGPPFQGHREVLEGLFAFYQRRQQKILDHLARGSATAYELVPVVFGRRDPVRLFLTLSEIVGNLEVLEEEGRVGREEINDVYQFRLQGES